MDPASWQVANPPGRKSTRAGANGVVELTPFEFLDRLADLVPPPLKHRHPLVPGTSPVEAVGPADAAGLVTGEWAG